MRLNTAATGAGATAITILRYKPGADLRTGLQQMNLPVVVAQHTTTIPAHGGKPYFSPPVIPATSRHCSRQAHRGG